MLFKSLKISGWRQYEDVSIDFHPQLTIITGANGAGKTTLLSALSPHFSRWVFPLVGAPLLDSIIESTQYFSGSWGTRNISVSIPINPGYPQMGNNNLTVIGTVEYSNGASANLNVPTTVGSTFNFQYTPTRQEVKGINISSHRPVFKYEQVTHIPTSRTSRHQAFDSYISVFNNRNQGANNVRSETYQIKETLISLATFGYGNAAVKPNAESARIYEGFQNILRIILPKSIGFQSLQISMPEVLLRTTTGDFPLDAVSGGIASIIDLAWQIYMYDNNGFPFVVMIDEPENHLHPEIQKSVLPNLIAAFPNCQFIVATHSPFIIGSMPNSYAYALKYKDNSLVSGRRVISVLLDRVDKSGTANEILREVLGLDDTMPNWVDTQIEDIISRYRLSGITKENVAAFKQELTSAGLGKYIPASLIKLIEDQKND